MTSDEDLSSLDDTDSADNFKASITDDNHSISIGRPAIFLNNTLQESQNFTSTGKEGSLQQQQSQQFAIQKEHTITMNKIKDGTNGQDIFKRARSKASKKDKSAFLSKKNSSLPATESFRDSTMSMTSKSSAQESIAVESSNLRGLEKRLKR